MQIEIGCGEVITRDRQNIEYPTLLTFPLQGSGLVDEISTFRVPSFRSRAENL